MNNLINAIKELLSDNNSEQYTVEFIEEGDEILDKDNVIILLGENQIAMSLLKPICEKFDNIDFSKNFDHEKYHLYKKTVIRPIQLDEKDVEGGEE